MPERPRARRVTVGTGDGFFDHWSKWSNRVDDLESAPANPVTWPPLCRGAFCGSVGHGAARVEDRADRAQDCTGADVVVTDAVLKSD